MSSTFPFPASSRSPRFFAFAGPPDVQHLNDLCSIATPQQLNTFASANILSHLIIPLRDLGEDLEILQSRHSKAARRKAVTANMPSYRSSHSSYSSASQVCANPLHTSFGEIASFEDYTCPSPQSEYSENCTSDCARVRPTRRQCSMPMPAFTYPFSSRVPSFPPTLAEDVGSEQASPSQTDQQGNPRQSLEAQKIPSIPVPFATHHAHRNSASTTTSDSTASSPTNASVADSISNNDTPATSPDTPASSQSLSSPSLASQIQSGKVDTLRQPAPKELPRPLAHSKRARNLKNLAVDTSGAMAYGKPAATATLILHDSQESSSQNPPSSPGFVKPMKPPPRKGSALGLSLVTPSTDSPPPSLAASMVPPTPSLIRPNALRHFPSSPSLPLMSPREPPEGGMRLPPLASRKVSVGFAEAPSEHDEDENPANPDAPQSRASTYLDGPICIYDPHIYLYYEPSCEQASSFDVILNVANEVKNPYTGQAAVEGNVAAALRRASDGLSEGIKSATGSVSLTEEQTPKASPNANPADAPRPEYIHVPWEHNTDIVPDLYDLVKVIEERVQCGKKILIHCQCGVSRSASLIVAYGLYKNPSITVQEAYDAVKRRSKWINPNMSLIMQLQEFRSELLKSSAGMPHRYPQQKAKSKITFTGPSLAPCRLRNQDLTGAGGDRPHSAPLPPEKEDKAGDASEPSSDRIMTPISPGPSSAPSGYAWPKDTDLQDAPKHDRVEKEAKSETPMEADQTRSLAHSRSESQMTPPNQSSNHEHRRPAALRLPDSHVTRIEPQSTGSIASMMSMSNVSNVPLAPAKPPMPDETFGLTSPRPTDPDGTSSHKIPAPLTTIVESPVQSSRNSTSDTLMSPRSQEFAMTSVNPPQDDGFGLTSPRPTTFADTIPHRLAPPSNTKSRAFSALFPQDQMSSSQAQLNAGERAKLRSRLGMSTSSSYDMRSEYVRGSKAAKTQQITIPSLGMPGAFPESPVEDDTLQSPRAIEFTKNPFASPFLNPEPADTLMSPRAAEFTTNPFDSATTSLPIPPRIPQASESLGATESGDGGSGQTTPKADVVDPRSPAQKGVSPIVRNIFDVMS